MTFSFHAPHICPFAACTSLMGARRASLASHGEGAHVSVLGKTKQSNISKTKAFENMVHGSRNYFFYPRTHFVMNRPGPIRPGPVRPDHDAFWCFKSRKLSSV